MTDGPPQPPQPTREHARIKEMCGTWNVECTYFMDPSQPPMTNEARETVEMHEPFWATGVFETNFMGAPFKGRSTVGYEPHRKQWVSTWIDSMSPHMFYFTGNYDDSRKILTMTGEGPSMMTGEMTRFRTVEEIVDPNTRKFEMFMNMPDGNEHRIFSYVYKRA